MIAMTIKEYMKIHKLTQPAVLYRIKKGLIEAKKDKHGKWEIEDEKQQEQDNKTQNKLELALQEIEHLQTRLQDKEEIIQAERRSNIALLTSLKTYQQLEHQVKPQSLLKSLLDKFRS